VLYIERDDADVVYGLIDGFVRETRTLPDGRTQGIRLACPGDLLGTEVLAQLPYQCTAEALTDCRVCRISRAEIAALHLDHPEQGLQLSAALGREAAELRESILMVGTLSAEERVEALLDRLMGSVPPGEWLKLPMSRAELAEFVGLAPETVSRVIHRLARAGHFEVRGRRIRVPLTVL
jgi:CRP/FNR family transcriptional regulator